MVKKSKARTNRGSTRRRGQVQARSPACKLKSKLLEYERTPVQRDTAIHWQTEEDAFGAALEAGTRRTTGLND